MHIQARGDGKMRIWKKLQRLLGSMVILLILPVGVSANHPQNAGPAERPRLQDIPDAGIGHNFRLIAHNPLIDPEFGTARGGNGNSIGISGNCAYISSRRNNQPFLILDISDPTKPTVAGKIDAPPNPSDTDIPGFPGFLFLTDLTAVESLGLLVVQVFDLVGSQLNPEANYFQLYDIRDCFNPKLVSVIKLPSVPHEHFIWQSGGTPNRVLLYVSHLAVSHIKATFVPTHPYFGKKGFPKPPADMQLRVFDLTNFRSFPPVIDCRAELTGIAPCSKELARFALSRFGVPMMEPPVENLPKTPPDDAVFAFNAGHGSNNQLHAVSTSTDGTRVFAAASNAGFYMLDSTPLANGEQCDRKPDIEGQVNPNACLKKLHPDPKARLDDQPPFTQNVIHSAFGVPGRPYVWVSDETANPPHRKGCPGGWVRIIYIGDKTSYGKDKTRLRGDLFPRVVGTFSIPENIFHRCDEFNAKHGPTEWSPHKAMVFTNLAFVVWQSAGIRAVDISNPFSPREVGYFFPKPVDEAVRAAVGGNIVHVKKPELNMRSFPMLKDGFIYVLDGFNGVYVLKYEGPYKEELPAKGLCAQDAVHTPGFLPCPPFK